MIIIIIILELKPRNTYLVMPYGAVEETSNYNLNKTHDIASQL